jgi:magnesium-protoporphyrin O-methyltransferase
VGAIRGAGVGQATFLDIGGGIGAIQHELLASGASRGVSVDASPSYLATARGESEARGHGGRVTYLEGDFVDLAPGLEPADIVTLDRVICCYHDMRALVDASAPLARRLYGLVFPREHLLNRLGVHTINAVQRVRGRPFHVFLHGTESVGKRVRRHGFRRLTQARSPLWHIHLYIREPGAPAGP